MTLQRLALIAALLSVVVSPPLRASEAPISRLPAASETDPEVKKMFDAMRARNARIININRVLANAPQLAVANQGLTGALRDPDLPRVYRELAILRAAHLMGSPYVIFQHNPMAQACGITQAQLDAIDNWRDSKLFDEKQRVVLAYAEGIAGSKHDVDDETFAALAKIFKPRTIMVLTSTITHYIDTSLMTKVLRIQTEPDGGVIPASCGT